ncbi:MAG: SIR2 family protein [Candidatus Limnocylindria bacterium]
MRNLVLLVGSGASFHLKLPSLRSVTVTEFETLARLGEVPMRRGHASLLRAFTDGGRFDYEDLIARVLACERYIAATRTESVAIGRQRVDSARLRDFRTLLKSVLVRACEWRRHMDSLDEDLRQDPLHAHREFLRRTIAARRHNLPRLRIFTTNYDLLIEEALDALQVKYVDGFVGTITRSFIPRELGLDSTLPTDCEAAVCKMHGSINWRAGGDSDAAAITQSHGTTDGAEAVVYPTPLKESDVMGYPYSELMRALSTQLTQPQTALLVVGYGFRDDHINRIIMRAWDASPSLQILVVTPTGVCTAVDNTRVEFAETPIGSLARVGLGSLSVLTGEAAAFQRFAALLPDPDEQVVPRSRLDDAATRLRRALLPQG